MNTFPLTNWSAGQVQPARPEPPRPPDAPRPIEPARRRDVSEGRPEGEFNRSAIVELMWHTARELEELLEQEVERAAERRREQSGAGQRVDTTA